MPNLPSKIIVGKSFHGWGFHSPTVRWWVERSPSAFSCAARSTGFHSPTVRWWVESFIQQLEKDLPQVSIALPLGGGLKGLRRSAVHRTSEKVSTTLPLGGGLRVFIIEDATLAI